VGGSNTAPTAVADTGSATEKGGVANALAGSSATGNVLTNDTDPDSGDTKIVTAVGFGTTAGALGTSLTGAHGGLVLNADGSYTYTINETDAAVQALRLSTDTLNDVFNYTMRDSAGATSSTTLTVTIQGANDAPVLAAQTVAQSAVIGQAYSFTLPTGTFTDVDNGDSLTYVATDSTGAALPNWLSFDATTRVFTGTPQAADAGSAVVKVTATDAGGLSASETFNLSVSATAPQNFSLFSASTPVTAPASFNEGQPLELGMKFTSSTAGQVTALKFYRSASDTGTDVLDLWSATGTKLASATFTNTSASGWQTVALATPVTITADTTYVASYHTDGAYVATSNYFTSPVTSGPLSATGTANGVYAYGGTSTEGLFPANSFNSTNYWADLVFQPLAA
jgi:VCBS repeat-containing protein